MTAPTDPPAPPPVWWSPSGGLLTGGVAGDDVVQWVNWGAAPGLPADAVRLVPEGHPAGLDACTVCDGAGTVHEDGYYVPGERFVEPPHEARCDACVGSGQREVQQIAEEALQRRAGAVPDTERGPR